MVGLRLCLRNRSAGSGREKVEDALLGSESRVEKSSSDEMDWEVVKNSLEKWQKDTLTREEGKRQNKRKRQNCGGTGDESVDGGGEMSAQRGNDHSCAYRRWARC